MVWEKFKAKVLEDRIEICQLINLQKGKNKCTSCFLFFLKNKTSSVIKGMPLTLRIG